MICFRDILFQIKFYIMKVIEAYITSFLILFLTATIPSHFMRSIQTPWYQCIKSKITPPNYVFPIVWTILYILLAIVLANIFLLPNTRKKTILIFFFSINLFLNILWSYFYFYIKSQPIAYLILISLISTTLAIIYYAYKLLPLNIFYMILPYYLWTCFAFVLSTITLNKSCK